MSGMCANQLHFHISKWVSLAAGAWGSPCVRVLRRPTPWFGVLVLVLLAAGCVPKTGGTAGGSRHTGCVVAVVPRQTQGAYWTRVERGARDAANRLGMTLKWAGPLTSSEVAAQKIIVENLLAAGVDGIAVAPIDRAAALPAIQAAEKTGMPAVLFDAFGARGGNGPIFQIELNQRQVGITAAQKMFEILGGKRARLVAFTGPSDVTQARVRSGSFAAWMTNASMDVVANVSCVETAAADSMQRVTRVLDSHVKDGRLQLDGIFAADPPIALDVGHAVQSFRARGITCHAVVVGYGDNPALVKLLRSKVIHVLLVPQPEEIGRLAVEVLARYLDGEQIVSPVDPGVGILEQ